MMRIFAHGVCIASLLASSMPLQAQSQPSQAAVSDPLPVGTCINLGNTLEPEFEGSWGGAPVVAEDFTRIKAAGFDTVRIPVRWHNKTLPETPWTIDESWMARVQQVVDQALAAGLNVILNSHHFTPLDEDPVAAREWHGAVWQQIASRFAGYPDETLWFELENEPHKNLNHSNLLETLAPAMAAVRAQHPNRPVIIGGENWSGINSLATLPLPEDPNVHPTFHYYDPFMFTHQGAKWAEPNVPPVGRKFPTKEDSENLANDVEKIRNYIARTGKTPFMGEVGAYDRHISTRKRAAYHRAMREAFAPTGIGMCMWAYANTFPFWDRKSGKWLPGMLSAIGLPEPK